MKKDKQIQQIIDSHKAAPEIDTTSAQFTARVMNTVECYPQRSRRHFNPAAVTVAIFSYAGVLLFCLLGGLDSLLAALHQLFGNVESLQKASHLPAVAVMTFFSLAGTFLFLRLSRRTR